MFTIDDFIPSNFDMPLLHKQIEESTGLRHNSGYFLTRKPDNKLLVEMDAQFETQVRAIFANHVKPSKNDPADLSDITAMLQSRVGTDVTGADLGLFMILEWYGLRNSMNGKQVAPLENWWPH